LILGIIPSFAYYSTALLFRVDAYYDCIVNCETVMSSPRETNASSKQNKLLVKYVHATRAGHNFYA
jgi:hypothetical protein